MRVETYAACSASQKNRRKRAAAAFSASGASFTTTKNVPPVGTDARASRGSGAATTGNFALSSR